MDHVVLLRPSGSRTRNMGTATISVRLQLGRVFIRNNSANLKHSLQYPGMMYDSRGRVEAGQSIWEPLPEVSSFNMAGYSCGTIQPI